MPNLPKSYNGMKSAATQPPDTYYTKQMCVCDTHIWVDENELVCPSESCTELTRNFAVTRTVIFNDIKAFLKARFANKEIAKMYHDYATSTPVIGKNVPLYT